MLPTFSNDEKYRLNVIFATITMAFILGQLIDAEGNLLTLSFLGVFVPFQIKFQTLITIAVSGLSAGGCIWLFNNHPKLGEHSIFPHIILPTFTAWSVNIFLNAISSKSTFWVTLFFGGTLLLIVIFTEYISLDQNIKNESFISNGLNFLSYLLFLMLLITLDAGNQRLFFKIPTIGLATMLISVRSLHYAKISKWQTQIVIASIIIVSQFTAAFHYINISSVDYGLIIIAPLFSFLMFMEKYKNSDVNQNDIVLSFGSLLIIWGLIFWI
jgi:hypothetical protein